MSHRKEIVSIFKRELNEVAKLKKSKDEKYKEMKQQVDSWIEDYEVAVDCCYPQEYLDKIRNESNKWKRQAILIAARRAC